MITGEQIRAARKLLGWRHAELAKQARISAHSVERAESSVGESFVPGQDMQAMRAALESAGVEFTNGDEPGVKLKRPGPQGGLAHDLGRAWVKLKRPGPQGGLAHDLGRA